MKKMMLQYRQGWSRLDLSDTPLGPISLVFSPDGLAALSFEELIAAIPPGLPTATMDWANAAKEKLIAYFSGLAVDFQSLPVHLEGTPFQIQVWQELRKIPWGATISYKELAGRVGSAKGFRAVGQANACNPIPIIIPCHRVIAADGSLGGYSSGLDRKEWLLRHEKAI